MRCLCCRLAVWPVRKRRSRRRKNRKRRKKWRKRRWRREKRMTTKWRRRRSSLYQTFLSAF